MKKIISIIIITVCSFLTNAQELKKVADPLLFKAKMLMIENSKNYDPKSAFEIYKNKAKEGNPEAMNALGIIYLNGVIVPVNEKEGLKWIEKAAQNGYLKAWHNLGTLYQKGIKGSKNLDKALYYFKKSSENGYNLSLFNWGEMVKNGEGAPQNFVKSLEIFEKGANLGISECIYAKGYMYYKGLGCTQNYSIAFSSFKDASLKGSVGSMYMLGLIFKNGYGINTNSDSASFWLSKAANYGDKRAIQELKTPLLENKNLIFGKEKITINQRKINKKISAQEIDGEYHGFIIQYDWSGKHIIDKSKITVKLNKQDSVILGEWIESDYKITDFKTTVTDSGLVFINSSIYNKNHYNQLKPIHYDFKHAELEMLNANDSVFLVGNISFYDLDNKEPIKTAYISLIKKQNEIKSNNKINSSFSDNKLINFISDFTAYPNPFLNKFKIDVNLQKETAIKISIVNMNGIVVFQKNFLKQPIGFFSQNLAFEGASGTYILNVEFNGQTKSTILIKE